MTQHTHRKSIYLCRISWGRCTVRRRFYGHPTASGPRHVRSQVSHSFRWSRPWHIDAWRPDLCRYPEPSWTCRGAHRSRLMGEGRGERGRDNGEGKNCIEWRDNSQSIDRTNFVHETSDRKMEITNGLMNWTKDAARWLFPSWRDRATCARKNWWQANEKISDRKIQAWTPWIDFQ